MQSEELSRTEIDRGPMEDAAGGVRKRVRFAEPADSSVVEDRPGSHPVARTVLPGEREGCSGPQTQRRAWIQRCMRGLHACMRATGQPHRPALLAPSPSLPADAQDEDDERLYRSDDKGPIKDLNPELAAKKRAARRQQVGAASSGSNSPAPLTSRGSSSAARYFSPPSL